VAVFPALPCVPCREASYTAEGQAGAWASDSDSGWSDIELDDVAAIKFRAVTPPWQRGAERQQMSVALQQRTAAAAAATMGLEPSEYQAAAVAANWEEGLGGLGSCWEDDADDTTAKLQEVSAAQAACCWHWRHLCRCVVTRRQDKASSSAQQFLQPQRTFNVKFAHS
jgi:hypothetical protein